MGNPEANPLVSTQKSADSLTVALHPLVLLTISDQITRHTLRELPGPIIGAILGQQNGREITMEHAFDCAVDTESDAMPLKTEWLRTRLTESECRLGT
jgi:COP9 signalosome complex subunit 6